MNDIIRVAVLRPVWSTYDYLPASGNSRPVVGGRVRVPFGHSLTLAVVTEITETTEFSEKLKPIAETIDEQPVLPPDLLQLAQWMSEYYHYPLGSVLETMLPAEARRGRAINPEPEKSWRIVSPEDKPDFKRAHRQNELWELLSTQSYFTDSQLRQKNVNKSVLSALLKNGLVEFSYIKPECSYKSPSFSATSEQQRALDSITSRISKFGVHVLDGVTGSGKTEVYIRAIREVLELGKQVLVLVPEISLTPQTADYFRSRFGSVAVLHSMRSNVQRFDVWSRIGTGEHRIVIGTRSAVFSPFKDLGLIVVDEEHDTSYKQQDTLRYSGRDAAIMRSNFLNIPCILGSATLSLETLHNIRRGRYSVTKLSHRPGTTEMPVFHVMDIRGHTLEGGISRLLLEQIRQHLDDNGQVLVLINRRGYAPAIVCQDCGWKAECADCDVKLTLHEVPVKELQCHHCEKKYSIPQHCPDCEGDRLISLGAATQRTEETLKAVFPDVPVHRVDRDSTNTNRKLEELFATLRNGKKSILVGTQMLSKGHHFPNVTLVAVLGADIGFLSSDFRAPERTAQLIVQVAGRAGRAERRGEVWIQSFDPDHPDLWALVKDGYEGFAETEYGLRENAELPPVSHMALIRAEGLNAWEQEQFLKERRDELRALDVETLGPSPASIERISSRWRYQMAVLSRSRKKLHEALRRIAKKTVPRSKVRWSIDVDPIDMC